MALVGSIFTVILVPQELQRISTPRIALSGGKRTPRILCLQVGQMIAFSSSLSIPDCWAVRKVQRLLLSLVNTNFKSRKKTYKRKFTARFGT